MEEEPIRALARAPRGLEEDEEEPGTAQAAPPDTSSRIDIELIDPTNLEVLLALGVSHTNG